MPVEIPIYQVNAFTDQPFAGNPAAVCPLYQWLPDEVLQQIAAENNLSETAFYVPEAHEYALRWFTPRVEVPLCGHATLAAGWVVFHREPERDQILFATQSGQIAVERSDDLYAINLPASRPDPCEHPEDLLACLGENTSLVTVVSDHRRFVVELENEAAVREFEPNLGLLEQLPKEGVSVTAPGDEVDFVSRYFAPAVGVPEDPVTGAAHCTLVPYWSRKLEKTTLHARQLSQRGGDVYCEHMDDRVMLTGNVVPYLEGVIRV